MRSVRANYHHVIGCAHGPGGHPKCSIRGKSNMLHRLQSARIGHLVLAWNVAADRLLAFKSGDFGSPDVVSLASRRQIA